MPVPWAPGYQVAPRCGGVQDPDDTLQGMPQTALEHVDVDLCLPLSKIAPQLARIVRKEIPADAEGVYGVPDEMENETTRLDPRTPEGCPSSGTPRALPARSVMGHCGKNMLSEKTETLENAPWVALNTL